VWDRTIQYDMEFNNCAVPSPYKSVLLGVAQNASEGISLLSDTWGLRRWMA
jgi:hypothetical protein